MKDDFLSKPIRLRGLKFLLYRMETHKLKSKPIRLRGLKSEKITGKKLGDTVEAYTASWIEICIHRNSYRNEQSKPIRLRGLK